MESSSRKTTDSIFSHAQEIKYIDENISNQSSQASISLSTPNTNLTSTSTSTSSSSPPKLLKSSTSEPDSKSTPQTPLYSPHTISHYPFPSTRSGIAPKISITTSINSMISNHQNMNVGLSLLTRDLMASPVEDFILGSPLEGFM
ncbi:uncharacterized protein EAE98_002775 [Botrytis deweyae]|uniref:REJ domain-containing protein n=1 Tax=Botrytis deweyae TaxID=2478750 RepID=A0ABQ7IUN7_9HELO|nr:uncharacterized protein EAE98_002775 [Botrytis deweyae]KAF7934730.1 hypothetical protein EAE98_002775 [Botrytis deweyae]